MPVTLTLLNFNFLQEKWGKYLHCLFFFFWLVFVEVILFFNNFKIYRKFEKIIWRVVEDSSPDFPYY